MNPNDPSQIECVSFHAMRRRSFLRSASTAAGLGYASAWTTIAEALANPNAGSGAGPNPKKPKSLIFLWMQGGPSQLETFDPHPNTKIGGETQSIATSLPGLEISNLLPQTAEIMHHATVIRSMVSKEGDHERATYTMKTGWRPDPTLIHPSIGAVLCHQSENNIEIPRHISIVSGQWPGRGGYMGPGYDAFQVGDPKFRISNLESRVDAERTERRLVDLSDLMESEFRRGRLRDMDRVRTQHETSTTRATRMMESEQINAFKVTDEPADVLKKFGDSPFGRGCLAAVRLVQQGVRCVEVELSGWDTHARNHEFHRSRCEVLDAAMLGLITELEARDLLNETLVVWGGEFGRTPKINVAEGRDHWPNGFSTVLFGGPFRRGYVHGATSAELPSDGKGGIDGVADPVSVEDLHATILSTFGIDFEQELQTPIGRPLALSHGKVCRSLLT